MRAAYRPPGHLSPAGQALWRKLVPAKARSDGRLALLTVALEAKDRLDQARDQLATEPLVMLTPRSGVAHLNPLLKVEGDARRQFITAWALLKLAYSEEEDAGEDY